MADNTPITPGTGTSIATDDIGGVQYQRMKLTLGNDGVSDGDVSSTNPMPVSGAFYPATQPVSGTVAVSNFPSSQAVTGTFWQATQPVSGTVTVGNASLAVTGTFWQATQPVSGPLTDTQLRATAVPVSGTFWQTTQPVSGPLTDTQLRATAVPVSAPTLTKGTQGANGFSVQDLKDAGRVLKTYTASAVTAVTSEALITLTPYADLSAGGGATTFGVTSGKRLRIQQIIVTVRCTSTVNVGGIVRLRFLAGSVLVGSPVHASVGCMGSNLGTAVIGNAQTFAVDFPDGLELSGTMQFGLTQLFSATTATIDVHVIGYEY